MNIVRVYHQEKKLSNYRIIDKALFCDVEDRRNSLHKRKIKDKIDGSILKIKKDNNFDEVTLSKSINNKNDIKYIVFV